MRPILRPAAGILSLALPSLGLVACDPGLPDDSVGVYVDGSSVHVAYGPLCPGERILGLSVLQVRGNVVGDSNDQVLWMTESPSGTRTSDWVVGEVGPSWVETVPLVEPLPSGRELAAQVETTMLPDATATFFLGDLRSDKALTGEGYIGLVQFRSRSPSSC
jgi:hypothetical protein